MKHDVDVIIMGAGMVGATLALGLARSGLRLAVVDAYSPAPIPNSEPPHLRVSAISYASEQILTRLDVWSRLRSDRLCTYRRLAVNEAPPQRGLAARLPDISNWARTEFSSDEAGISHLGHILENDHLQAALHACMAEQELITVFCPHKVERFELDGVEKRVHLDNGEVLAANLLVGAEGAQSPVREAAKLGQFKEQYEQAAFACTVACDGGQQDITWQMFRPEGPLAYLPLPSLNGQAYASLVWYDAPATVKALQEATDSELLQRLHKAYPDALPRLQSVIARGSFPLYKSHAQRYYQDGVVLVGDAAHTINPLAGQGVNLGLMDAAVLIELIAQSRVENHTWWSDQVLAEYQRRRRGANQRMMSMMDVFYYGFSNRRLSLTVLRNLGLGLAQRSGPLKRAVLSQAVGLAGDRPKLAEPV